MNEVEAAELHLGGGEYQLCSVCHGSCSDGLERDGKCYFCDEGVVPTTRYLNALNTLCIPIGKPPAEKISEAKYLDEWDRMMNAGMSP